MSGLRMPSGFSAVLLGLIYIAAFVYFGAFFSYPASGTPGEKMRFLAEHQLGVSIVYLSIYVLFGVLLAILVVGVHETLKSASSQMASLASIFGAVWVGLVIASGMIYTVGLDQSVRLLDESPDTAFALWRTVSVVQLLWVFRWYRGSSHRLSRGSTCRDFWTVADSLVHLARRGDSALGH
jgi:hypothetical protein